MNIFTKQNAIITTGILLFFPGQILAGHFADSSIAYMWGVGIALLWSRWAQDEIDKRRKESDKVARASLQKWYRKKHETTN